MPIPENAQNIYTFLTGAGLSPNAAAGILGNIEQESGGNPSAGHNPPGSGLIQQLGYPTGQSLQAAEQAVIDYINKNGSIADVNAHAQTPTAAAVYFSDKYERPSAAAANLPNRIASAVAVAAAAASGNWPTGSGNPNSGGGIIPQPVIDAFGDLDNIVKGLIWFTKPSNIVRIIAGAVAVVVMTAGVTALVAAAK